MQSEATGGGHDALYRKREAECSELELLAHDASQAVELDAERLRGLYQNTHERPQCSQCARLQTDNRVLLLACYRKQDEILDLLGGDSNDSCCCFVIKLG